MFRLMILFMPCVGWAQQAVWTDAFQFRATNAGYRWAIAANVKGQVVSDGQTVDVLVESAELSRPGNFDTPGRVVSIQPAIVRHGDKGSWSPVIVTDRVPVKTVINPGESVKLGPFRARLNIADFPLATGDSVFFHLWLAKGNVPVHGTALPVKQSLAWCGMSWEQFKKKQSPLLQVRHFCQDTYGRTRTEDWYYPSMDSPSSSARLVGIHIADPVSNWVYDLNLNDKKAYRRKGFYSMAGFGAVIGGVVGGLPGTNPKPVESDKWLGTQQINGVTATGNLHTTVYPAGNPAPPEATFTEEVWYYWRINRPVRRVTSHSVNGDYQMDLKDIVLGEPDTALFRVPADYEIIDR